MLVGQAGHRQGPGLASSPPESHVPCHWCLCGDQEGSRPSTVAVKLPPRACSRSAARVAGVVVEGPLLWSFALQLANPMACGAAALGAPKGKGVAAASEVWSS